MVEAADLVKGMTLQVNIAGATTQIEKRGLYDFDANQQAVKVLDGKAKVLQASQVKTIDKGHEILLSQGNPNLKTQDFDKKIAQADPLYVWSNVRSQQEAQANAQVASTLNVYGGSYGPGWYWDPFWADYAFIPGAGFLYSPFGWGFYSPAFVYASPFYGFYGRGFYGRGFYGRGFYGHGWHGGGVAAAPHAAFAGGGFHGGGGGFHGGGGGFHGGGGGGHR